MTESSAAPDFWPAPSRIETHLGEIEVRDVGEGPVLVFLHLILAEASHWDRMPPLLADGYRCLFPTLPMGAHRLPAREGADVSPAGLARAISDLLEAKNLRDVTLVGNDSGGAIAQLIAANHPERIGRVVLTNCDMYDAFPPQPFGYFHLLPWIPGSLAVLGRVLKIRALWPLPIVFGLLANEIDATKIDRWADALSADPRIRRDALSVMKGMGPDVTNDVAERLRSTDLPFLLAWGEDDRAFRIELAERFVAEHPTAKLVPIADCKTFVCWDQPERLAELLREFVPA